MSIDGYSQAAFVVVSHDPIAEYVRNTESFMMHSAGGGVLQASGA
jgi:hypothetical protein